MSEEDTNNRRKEKKMNPDLKNDVWTEINNICKEFVSYGVGGYGDSTYKDKNAQELWAKFFHKKINKMPYAGDYLEKINYLYDELNEEEVIGLINFILERNLPNKEKIKNTFNGILEENNAPYRIINGMVQPFSDKEITAILENAYQHAPNEIIRKHLVGAARLYSDANSFDYRTSCQESINALEACLQFFYKNKDRLGQNINRLEKDGKYDKHIVQCAEKIYAFRNDNTAHANKSNGYQPDKEDALLIHTLCCGFVYYFRNKK